MCWRTFQRTHAAPSSENGRPFGAEQPANGPEKGGRPQSEAEIYSRRATNETTNRHQKKRRRSTAISNCRDTPRTASAAATTSSAGLEATMCPWGSVVAISSLTGVEGGGSLPLGLLTLTFGRRGRPVNDDPAQGSGHPTPPSRPASAIAAANSSRLAMSMQPL
jgi:hypothetical protein